MNKYVIAQGAEAIIYKENNGLVKKRIKKSYRLSEIDDKIRKSRTRRESKILQKLDFVPKVLRVDYDKKIIEMEFVDGELVRDILDNLKKEKRKKICRIIGENIAILHNESIIHGDLTTSNFILKDDKVYFIDFGLSFFSDRIEDKAVDLHLLKQALESKHYRHFERCFEDVLQGYNKVKDYNKIIERLKKVESRGRYKKKIKKCGAET